jgi:membrane protein
MYLRRLGTVLRKATNAWMDDHAQSMGAALSYYTVFSLAPLLLIAISVAGLVFGRDAAQGAVVDQLQGLIGQGGAQAVQDLLKNVSKPSEGVIATVTGVVVLVIGATSVFGELQDDLDRIWQVPTRQKVSGWWIFLRARLLSMGMIFAMGFLLLVSLAASAAFDAFASWSTSSLAGWEPLAHGVNFVVSFVLTTALFAMIYRFMPQATIEWRDVGIGALVTAFLFSIGKILIGLYIGKSALASGFGAAGSLAVLLAWVYYSAQIFLFGAEFTWAYAHAFGSRQGAGEAAASPRACALRTDAPVLPTR